MPMVLPGRDQTSKRLEQPGEQPPVRTPDALRTQFDDAINAVEGSQQFKLTIKGQNRRTKTHCLNLSDAFGAKWMVPVQNAIGLCTSPAV
jgi:hypothetical protein